MQAPATRYNLSDTQKLRLPTRPQSVRVARTAMREFGAEQGITGDVLDDILLAVTEAVTNSVRHAHPDGETGMVDLAVALVGHHDLVVRVCDDGRWAGDAGRQQGLGLGLPLMHTLADDCVISAGSAGTVVELRFRVGRD